MCHQIIDNPAEQEQILFHLRSLDLEFWDICSGIKELSTKSTSALYFIMKVIPKNVNKKLLGKFRIIICLLCL